MASQTVTFDFEINEKVRIVATETDAWITGQFVGADGTRQYNVSTTLPSGQPEQRWLRGAELAAGSPE